MKNILAICFVLSVILIQSCQKDSIKSSIKNSVSQSLAIDETAHCFINENGKRYIENTLLSQQDSLVFELKMNKGIEYRISTSQPNTLINQTRLTLVNIEGDTLTESLNESYSKSVIVVEAPQTSNYYVIVQLAKRTNPKFTFRLFFEELVDNEISFANKDWEVNGEWEVQKTNTAALKNSDSRIYRHLKLSNPLAGNPDVSFVIQCSNNEPNFGFIMDASERFMEFSEYFYELTNSGYAFLAFKKDLNYSIIELFPGSMSLQWGSIEDLNFNFSTGIKVDLKFENNQYWIYLNNTQLQQIKGNLNNFHILTEDCGDGITTIKDFQFIE